MSVRSFRIALFVVGVLSVASFALLRQTLNPRLPDLSLSGARPPLRLVSAPVVRPRGPHLPTPAEYSVFGVDVSRYQGRIDWQALQQSGRVHFVYMKATEGATLQDITFRRRWQRTGELGILRGAYHFYTLCRSEREQFANIKRTVPRDRRALPLALDLEFHGNCNRRPSVRRLRRDVGRLSRRIARYYGRPPIYYVTVRFYRHYIRGSRFQRRLWVTDVWKRPDYARSWLLWQFSARGSVAGIRGPVDRNAFHGSLAQFHAWAGGCLVRKDLPSGAAC